MNQEIKIAVCDDLAEDRENITQLLSEYTDKNNLYVKIEEFSSGEAFLSSDTSVYSLVFMDIFMSGMNGMETAKKLDFKKQPGADRVREHQYGVCSRGL